MATGDHHVFGNWLAERLEEVSLQRSAIDPALFYNLDLGIGMLVHVDDMLLIGPEQAVRTLFKKLQGTMKLRETGCLRRTGDEEKFLNKLIKRTEHGFILRGNTWIIDELVKRAGVENCKFTATPAVKYAVRQVLDAAPLVGDQIGLYRSIVGGLMYVGHDRCDIQYSVKEAGRSMQNPTEIDLWKVKRICKYLAHHREMDWKLELREQPEELRVSVDSDWAGCVDSRRSTSGGVMHFGDCTLLTWSRTQGSVALSSMEAEYRGLVTGAQEGLLIKNLASELGWPLNVVIECDSISAQASAQRRGVLHVKHMAIRLLFDKELVECGLLRMEHVTSGDNLAFR